MDGSESEMMKEVKLFADMLKERINIKMNAAERLTSFEASKWIPLANQLMIVTEIILDGWLSNMYIPEDFIDKLLETVDIVDVIGQRINIQRSGSSLQVYALIQ